jgi:hypothetical protein
MRQSQRIKDEALGIPKKAWANEGQCGDVQRFDLHLWREADQWAPLTGSVILRPNMRHSEMGESYAGTESAIATTVEWDRIRVA